MNKKPLSIDEITSKLAKSLHKDTSKTFSEWILNNNIKTDKGTPYTFENRKYLIDIMNDFHPKIAIPSSAQVGKTVGFYLKSMYMNLQGLNVCFSEPTQDLGDMLTKTKLNPLIAHNPVFSSRVSSGNLQQKQIGDRFLYLVYTFGNLNVGFSSDINVYDEADRSNEKTLNLLKGRTLDSDYRYEWIISNPTVSDSYLDRIWKGDKCDQKHWSIDILVLVKPL